MRWPTRVLVLPLFALACGQNDGPTPARDAATTDATGGSVTFPDLPPGCPPAAGNENGIGTPCTATGSECTGSLQCSCKDWFGQKMPAEMPCFCTTVTFGTSCTGCGSNAPCCTYSIPFQTATVTVSACFPAACAPGNTCPTIQ